jgi:hypothetical protein
MAKSKSDVRMRAVPDKLGGGWHVVIEYPDRGPDQVSVDSETKAQDWIINKSTAWLAKLGYK